MRACFKLQCNRAAYQEAALGVIDGVVDMNGGGEDGGFGAVDYCCQEA